MVANLGFGPTQKDDRELMRMLAAQQAANTPQARAAEQRFMQQPRAGYAPCG